MSFKQTYVVAKQPETRQSIRLHYSSKPKQRPNFEYSTESTIEKGASSLTTIAQHMPNRLAAYADGGLVSISTTLIMEKAEAGAVEPTDETCHKSFMKVYRELSQGWHTGQGNLSDPWLKSVCCKFRDCKTVICAKLPYTT